MKKYILKRKGEISDLGKFNTKQEAVDAMDDVIYKSTKYIEEGDTDWVCPFDFELEEFEVAEDPADLVPDYESALKYLGLGNTIIIVDRVEGERNPLTGPTKAFLELATIAAAWNKIDGFVPDFSNAGQYKYYPWFEYKKSAAGFVFAYTGCTAAASFGSRLCFATRNRAKQFGKKFQDLYNQMFL